MSHSHTTAYPALLKEIYERTGLIVTIVFSFQTLNWVIILLLHKPKRMEQLKNKME